MSLRKACSPVVRVENAICGRHPSKVDTSANYRYVCQHDEKLLLLGLFRVQSDYARLAYLIDQQHSVGPVVFA